MKKFLITLLVATPVITLAMERGSSNNSEFVKAFDERNSQLNANQAEQRRVAGLRRREAHQSNNPASGTQANVTTGVQEIELNQEARRIKELEAEVAHLKAQANAANQVPPAEPDTRRESKRMHDLVVKSIQSGITAGEDMANQGLSNVLGTLGQVHTEGQNLRSDFLEGVRSVSTVTRAMKAVLGTFKSDSSNSESESTDSDDDSDDSLDSSGSEDASGSDSSDSE